MKKLLLFIFILQGFIAFAQSFTPGNLVVARYGDGENSLPADNTTVPVFLDEYDLSGNIVQTLPMPVEKTEETRNRVLTGSANVYYEGLLTLSPNGQYLVSIGHNIVPGEKYRGNTQRTVGVITSDGFIDITTAVRPNIGVPRCATTNNGVNLWIAGSGGGLKYKKINSIAPNDVVISRPPAAHNSVYIYNGQLYYTSNYVISSDGPKIGVVGEGLPLEPSQVTNLPGFSTNAHPEQIVMMDHDTDSPDPDIMYVALQGNGGLQKWTRTGDKWEYQGAVFIDGVTNEIIGLTGNLSEEGDATLFATTSTKIISFSDEHAIRSDFSEVAPPRVLSLAGENTIFKGIAFTPGTTPKVHKKVSSSSRYGSLIQEKTDLIQSITKNETYQRYPGVEETDLRYISNRGVPIALSFLKVSLKNQNVSIETMTPNDKEEFDLQTVRKMIEYKNESDDETKVVAASNGDYFSWTGEPDGTVYKDGKMIKDLPDDKYFFAIQKDGSAVIGDHRIYNNIKSDLKEAVGGRFFLVHYGEIMTDHLFDTSIEPRSTVGLLSEDDVVFMWVDGRQIGHSAGLSLRDMAKIYKAIGAREAINIDGGGSSTFLMREKDGSYETHNSPSDGERQVANGLAVMIKNEILDKHQPGTPIISSMAISPNPASINAEISFELAETSNVKVELYNNSGRFLKNLYVGKAQGRKVNKVSFSLNNIPIGVYFVKLTTARGESLTQQLIVR